MSGLFRYNTNSLRSPSANVSAGGPASSSTPNTSNVSPFKTTVPSGLFGKNTPGVNWMCNAESPHSFTVSSAGGSPDKLKSVNEMEKRLDRLEKDNFNLRMKLFYQQESLASQKSEQDMAKEIVELKVQIANHAETIKEKTDAVVKASKALNFMEAMLAKNEKEAGCLKARIAELECCLSVSQQKGDGTVKSIDCSVSPEGNHLHDSCKSDVVAENPMLKKLETENGCLKGEVQRLQETVKDMMSQMDCLMEEDSKNRSDMIPSELFDELKCKYVELEQEYCRAKSNLENTAKNLECAKAQLLEVKKKGADLICENEELSEKLQRSECGLKNATKIVEKVMGSSATLSAFNTGDSFCLANNSTLSGTAAQMAPPAAGGDCDALACEMRRVIKEKCLAIDEERKCLLKEGKSVQCVEQALEAKRADMNRLNRVLQDHEENQKKTKACQQQPQQTQSFGSARTTKTCDMTTISNMCSGLQAMDSQAMKRLEDELECHRRITEEAEAKTSQMTEVVTVLRLRLEELAGFLKTLLQHKDILGLLCRERVCAIEKAVDRSLNLTSSMDISNMSMGDITNVSKLFGDFSLQVSAGQKDGMVLGADPLGDCSQAAVGSASSTSTVEALKNEIVALRCELEKAYKKREAQDSAVVACGAAGRKERRSMPCRASKQSDESEWSGPDLNVSAQRIGIEVAKDRAILISSSDEEIVDLACASSSSAKRSIMEKMLKYEREIEGRDNKVLEVKLAMVELEAQLKQEQARSKEVCKNLDQCREMNVTLDRQVAELKKKLSDAQVDLDLARSQLKCEAEKWAKEMECRLAGQKEEWVKKNDELRRRLECELESQKKGVEQQRVLVGQKEKEMGDLKTRVTELQQQLEKMKEKEEQWCRDIQSGEEKAKKLRKTLDELTIQATRAAVERTKAGNERDKALLEKKELEAKYDCLLEERIKLKDRLFETDRLNTELCGQLKCHVAKKECDATSGYGSEETRPSSPENKEQQQQQQQQRCAAGSKCAAIKGEKGHDCDQVDCENQELKRRLAHMKRTLEHTFNKLKMSNQMKEKVERDIQQQLIKTKNVLKLARDNIENQNGAK